MENTCGSTTNNISSNATRPPRRHQACLLVSFQRRVTRRAPTKRARRIVPCLGNFRCSALWARMHQMQHETFHQNHGPACFATLHQVAHVTATNQAHNCHRFGSWWLQCVLNFSERDSPMYLEHDTRMQSMARLAMPPTPSRRPSVNSVLDVCASGLHMCLPVGELCFATFPFHVHAIASYSFVSPVKFVFFGCCHGFSLVACVP